MTFGRFRTLSNGLSGISNGWGNAKGGLHEAGGLIGDIGGGERRNDPNCFPSGTMILTPFGETPIEELRVGDKVMSFDPSLEDGRGRIVAKEVTVVNVENQKTLY